MCCGGTAIGERIRELLLDKANKDMTARTELLLYAASRAQHVEQRILPALQAGRAVVLDRYMDSTMAFQGYGRQLGRAMVEQANDMATGGLTPDLTFVLVLEPQAARERMSGKPLDRMELEAESFRRRVYEGFLSLKTADPARIVLLDARQSIEELSEAIGRILRERICKE